MAPVNTVHRIDWDRQRYAGYSPPRRPHPKLDAGHRDVLSANEPIRIHINHFRFSEKKDPYTENPDVLIWRAGLGLFSLFFPFLGPVTWSSLLQTPVKHSSQAWPTDSPMDKGKVREWKSFRWNTYVVAEAVSVIHISSRFASVWLKRGAI